MFSCYHRVTKVHSVELFKSSLHNVNSHDRALCIMLSPWNAVYLQIFYQYRISPNAVCSFINHLISTFNVTPLIAPVALNIIQKQIISSFINYEVKI